MKQTKSLTKRTIKVQKTIDIMPIRYGSLLSFSREPGNRQVLCITLWYVDGTTDELITTSPHIQFSEDIERQYLYMRMYLQKSFQDVGIVAFQGSVSHIINGELSAKPAFTWAKVDCTQFKPFKPGQFCEHD